MAIFDNILLRGAKENQIPARTIAARNWYRNEAQKLTRSIPGRSLINSASEAQVTTDMQYGLMYSFVYDPKMKKTLPYYDTFPLIFPVRLESDGFTGINFHYLPHILRAKLMDALYTTSTNKKYDDSTRLRISYDILISASKFRLFQPTLKKYLRQHIRSRFLEIPSTQWDIALFLPTESFKKADTQRVWSDSRKKIGM